MIRSGKRSRPVAAIRGYDINDEPVLAAPTIYPFTFYNTQGSTNTITKHIFVALGEGEPAESKWKYLMERITDCCSTLMPFEKARLRAVALSSDYGSPMFAKVDLSHLPDEDIFALARILPKLGGGTATG